MREVPAKSLGNFREVGGGTSGKSWEFPEAPAKSDSLSATRQNRPIKKKELVGGGWR